LEANSYLNYFFYFLNTGNNEKAEEFLGKYRNAINEFGMVSSPAEDKKPVDIFFQLY
jgi:hypothetical protein